MPAIAVCPQCESAHWADKPHNCGAEHDRLEAQAEAIKARRGAQLVELVQRCSQLKWLAACVLAKGPDLPSRQQWASLYRLAEGAEPLAKETLAKFPASVRELEMHEYRFRAGPALAAGTHSAETSETSAPSEGCQSGPKGNAQDIAQPSSNGG